ncbi:SAM-dependent methyltransferase [Streptomyces sp. JH002]|uniref:TRM11 family SAM-dependent methyltransferase n=1 Tax=Streptomyces TaxID=1883 RepID=UPI0036788A92
MNAMHTYGFLLLPSHNRLYAAGAADLARAELLVLSDAVLDGAVREVAAAELGGVPYVTFRAPELTAGQLRHVANLSSLYALFLIEGEPDAPALRPVPVERLDRFPSDLITIQKYPGKTNEDFTKLLLNVTAMACDAPQRLLSGGLRVLDPLCGRGTTLNQALMYGLDSAGVEQDARSVEAYETFLRHWLKAGRLKHRAESGQVRRDKRTLGRRLSVEIGENKELYKKGQSIGLTVVQADTVASDQFFRPGSFDLIVTDAPYGVRYGSRTRGEGGGLTRSPLPLLSEAVPVWARLLRTGGAIGISWNTYGATRAELAEVLADAGFEVRDTEPYRGFEHRVDQAITRDLIVARKTA